MTAFLLALTFEDDMFIGINSPANFGDFCVPEGEPLLELRVQPQS
jgi:hypothetical protein